MAASWLCRLRLGLRRAPGSFYPYLSYARSFLRGRRQVRRVWPEGRIELGAAVALFTHFDPRQKLADHVIAYVRALHGSGFSVVFITNSGDLRQDSLIALQPYCRAVIIRRNVGYDFGAVREVLDFLGLPRVETERLLIANDSVYGPLRPIADMVAQINFDEADVWLLRKAGNIGITCNPTSCWPAVRRSPVRPGAHSGKACGRYHRSNG